MPRFLTSLSHSISLSLPLSLTKAIPKFLSRHQPRQTGATRYIPHSLTPSSTIHTLDARVGDGETGRQSELETERRRDGVNGRLFFSASLLHPLSPSLPLPLTLSLLLSLIFFFPTQIHAQLTAPDMSFETYGVVSSAASTPFWLRTNQEGMVRWEGAQTIGRFQAYGGQSLFDSDLRFSYGADLVGRAFQDNTLYFNQIYGSLTYGPLFLTAGRKTRTIGETHETLTSGSMGVSRNATPIPRIQAGFSEYVTVPFTFDFMEIKGHIAHGWLDRARYVESPWLHEKSGYARFGHNHSRFSVYGGLVHFGLWGGTSPDHGELPTGMRNFWRMFFVTGADAEADENVPPGWEVYMFGDSKGIWDFGATYEQDNFSVILYRHIPIENKGGLKFQSPQDGLWGIALQREERNKFINNVVYEFIYTKWQNGSDGPGSRASGLSGWVNYYNNTVYRSGWTYHMQTIGSPLLTPHRGNIGEETFRIDNNRVVGHHIGLSGRLTEQVYYRSIITYTRNYGTYWDRERSDNFRFEGGSEQYSALVEFEAVNLIHPGITLSTSLGMDIGELYQNSIGIIFGLKYRL